MDRHLFLHTNILIACDRGAIDRSALDRSALDDELVETRDHQARVTAIGADIATNHAELLRRLA